MFLNVKHYINSCLRIDLDHLDYDLPNQRMIFLSCCRALYEPKHLFDKDGVSKTYRHS